MAPAVTVFISLDMKPTVGRGGEGGGEWGGEWGGGREGEKEVKGEEDGVLGELRMMLRYRGEED